jgi:hypothetical protein
MAADIVHFAQDTLCARNDFDAGRRGARECTTVTLEQLKPQFFCQESDLTTHARLRGVELPRRSGYVQAVLLHRDVLELHAAIF